MKVGMFLLQIRNICEEFMLKNGANLFWYWNVGAFVFFCDETTVSISGKNRTSKKIVNKNDIITVDLSPQNNNIWWDYARTIIIENGVVVDNVEDIQNLEWKQGLKMWQYLHQILIENATPDMTFEELYFYINDVISKHEFMNLGHSIVENKDDRVYIEKGNQLKLSEVKIFKFEPHINLHNSKYGYKREDIYYFEKGKLVKLWILIKKGNSDER